MARQQFGGKPDFQRGQPTSPNFPPNEEKAIMDTRHQKISPHDKSPDNLSVNLVEPRGMERSLRQIRENLLGEIQNFASRLGEAGSRLKRTLSGPGDTILVGKSKCERLSIILVTLLSARPGVRGVRLIESVKTRIT